jgi:hypothetical protein
VFKNLSIMGHIGGVTGWERHKEGGRIPRVQALSSVHQTYEDRRSLAWNKPLKEVLVTTWVATTYTYEKIEARTLATLLLAVCPREALAAHVKRSRTDVEACDLLACCRCTSGGSRVLSQIGFFGSFGVCKSLGKYDLMPRVHPAPDAPLDTGDPRAYCGRAVKQHRRSRSP